MFGLQNSTQAPTRNSFKLEDFLQLSLAPENVPVSPGVMSWNAVDGCIETQQLNGTTLQNGQELYFYAKASGDILNGELCQFAGVQGDHILAKKVAFAEVAANPQYLIGVATHNILNGEYGYITWFGKVNGVYTNTPANNDLNDWVEGDLLYFNNTTGQLTNTPPTPPDRRIIVAVVIKVQTGASETGIILVRPSLSSKLTDLEDVNGTPLDTTGQVLLWDQTNLYWDPSSKVYLDEDATDGPLFATNKDTTARDLHVECGTDKTLVLDETVWVDIDFPIIARSVAANNPTPATLIGNLTAPRWAVNDYLMCEGQEMIHMWKEGSTCYWHIHLITNGTEAVNKYVKFEIEYTWATLDGQLQAVTTTASSDLLIPASTPDRTHLIYPIANFTPTAAKIGTQVYARLKRVASTGTAPAADPFVPMFQIHIEVDTLGSRQLGLK